MKDIIRMNQLAYIITEDQAKKMMQILNENETSNLNPNENIISFLSSRKDELLQAVSKKLNWDEFDWEEYQDEEISMGGNADGEPDPEIAGLGEGGLDFSFNRSKVKDVYGDAYNFTIKVGGKTVYGISYNV
jgi:hypothetical protein